MLVSSNRENDYFDLTINRNHYQKIISLYSDFNFSEVNTVFIKSDETAIRQKKSRVEAAVAFHLLIAK